ncbi:hypothetical protein FPOA_10610 [Fusarium poae]|uniref:Agglutinin-like protein N-terminal domain-containing protein n=1 Tax=Fusarium poae TaxID=36050 RepID=A0A1B8AEH9_FUSPO|nr:hypothetical protein FPOA_10610 [Fusarium poae]
MWSRVIPRHVVLFALLAGDTSARKQDVDCPDGKTLLQIQPIRLVEGSKTSYTTETRTFLIPADASFVTTTLFGDGPETTYTIPPQGTPPVGTIIVKSPKTTVTSIISSLAASRTRTLTPSRSGDPTTVVVEQPDIPYKTITRTGNSDTRTTRTVQPDNGDETGTIVVEIPRETAPYVTVTRTGTLTVPVTSTLPPTDPNGISTVFVIIPPETVTYTDTRQADTSDTLSSSRPYTTFTRTGTGALPRTYTQTPDGPGETGTVVVELAFVRFNTITDSWTGSTTRTFTALPFDPSQTGTVMIQVPAEATPYVTTTRTGTGSLT